MVNLTTTNNDLGSVILENAKFRDELLTFAGINTFVEGTLLARQAVALAVVAAADGGNTGDGTATLATVVAGPVPLVGIYVFTITTAVVNGGIGQLTDPNGAIVASDLVMTVGAGAATVFEAAGLQFTITDAATDFIVGDNFTLTVATGAEKLVPFAIAGAGGAQIPKAVLTYDVTSTGAEDIPIRAMISGGVRKERLVIDLDGDDSNITDAILDQLRDYSIYTDDVQELNQLDNQ